MSERIVLRAKGSCGKHTAAVVLATPSGYVVRLKELVLTGYGNRFDLHEREHHLLGPADDSQTWARFAGCACGRQYAVTSLDLDNAIRSGKRVITLSAWQVQS